eukprot:TRINITY_DN68372_c0_g1_i1.p1 TRINITY_DN68372_c0_g1~~TRINITY_DN68372_c0_g1_i1.p1  ORF type:complete len:174 (+),score=22.40 TRINITY_DN68372_c0_g1_i1:69-524(+)
MNTVHWSPSEAELCRSSFNEIVGRRIAGAPPTNAPEMMQKAKVMSRVTMRKFPMVGYSHELEEPSVLVGTGGTDSLFNRAPGQQGVMNTLRRCQSGASLSGSRGQNFLLELPPSPSGIVDESRCSVGSRRSSARSGSVPSSRKFNNSAMDR